MAGAGLGQLDGLADGGVGGHAVEEHELEEPELQRRAHGWIEGAIHVGGDDVVERQAPLDGPEGQLLGQRPVARLEAAGLACRARSAYAPSVRVRSTTAWAARRAGLRVAMAIGAPQ